MMQKELLTKKDQAAVGEEISQELAADFINNFQHSFPSEIKWFSMGKTILDVILAQPGCAGIRFYNGINENGQKTLVYVGVDAEGNDIVKRTVVQADGSVVALSGTIADRNDNSEKFIWYNPSTWF